MALLRRLARLALEALFPASCLGCGQEGCLLCPSCLEAAPRAMPPRCPICWQSWSSAGPCRQCACQPPAYEAARSVFIYRGVVQEAVQALKFRGMYAIAPAMAGPMARLLAAWAPPVDAIVPVPLPRLRERTRGYNQARLLASEVGRAVGLPVVGGVLWRRWTPPQAGLSAQERRGNVAGAFRVQRGIPGWRLLVVDDVLTTGATLDACARALREAGAQGVWGLTFARED